MLFELADSRSRRLLAFLPFLPAILWSVVMTTKASILWCAVFWLASYFAAFLWAERDGGQQIRRGIIFEERESGWIHRGAYCVHGYRANDTIWRSRCGRRLVCRRSIKGSFCWLFGSVFFLSLRCSQGHMDSPAWGLYTFAGPYELMGIASREMGIYGEAASIEVGDSETNVFTIFRGLIEDFTPVGTLIVLTLFGFVAGYAFERIRKGKMVAVFFLSLFYAVTILSHVGSLFAYNSIILAFGLWLAALIRLNRFHK